MKVPARTDRACFPPPGYVTVYEFSLRARLRFPPSSELIDILTICGVCLSQFSYRAMSIVMGLIVLFRDRGVVPSSECLSRMGRLFSDAQGRISFRSKWLDIRTRDPSKGWISNFFYVQNDWGLQEKWGKLKELPVPLHIGAEDLLRILKLPDLDALHYEVRYLSRYVDEEYLFKVGLSTQAGRSHAQMLKKSARVPEVVPQKNHSKRPGSEEGLQASRKKRADEVLTVVSKGPRASPSKSYIPEDVLNHQCIGRRRAEELNKEFVKGKYLQGEYKKKYDSKVKEMKVVEDQLEGCRTELANKITSVSSQNERMDRLHIELVEAQATIKQQEKAQQVLEAENERLQSVLSEKEAQQLPSVVIEEFKKSYAFKIIIKDHIQEARSHIYDVEVKALEAECIDDGFIRGFMKGVRTVHRKTGAEIEGLTPSQASGDASSDSGGGGLTDASKIIPSAHDGDRRRFDDVASIITSDSLAVIRKKFHVTNDVLIIALKRTDMAHTPPQGFVAVYEMTLHAGLRFPLAPKLLNIFKACGVALPQFLCRAITIIVT
ncbi:hypothetical protein IEQ34_009088 [Dendrobium chrysotoxum]|uniref:Uncharacterized protein n=1 Tax=Dendrobium chrysotoxum TaxID=161865 RepID=A0AAV7H1U2_DENCH|nr:hypothetical protein IEQ34_009088 [Dendrobium chrysotoxum]